MWVFEEDIGGKKLTEIINTQHENVKYLPGHKLPSNVVSPNTLQGREGRVACLLLKGDISGAPWTWEVSQEGCSRHQALLCTAPKLVPGHFLEQENLNASLPPFLDSQAFKRRQGSWFLWQPKTGSLAHVLGFR